VFIGRTQRHKPLRYLQRFGLDLDHTFSIFRFAIFVRPAYSYFHRAFCNFFSGQGNTTGVFVTRIIIFDIFLVTDKALPANGMAFAPHKCTSLSNSVNLHESQQSVIGSNKFHRSFRFLIADRMWMWMW